MSRTRRATKIALSSTLIGVASIWIFQALGGCGQTVEVGSDDALLSGGASSGDAGGFQLGGLAGASGSGSVSGSAGVAHGGEGACVPTECRGKPYLCGNCKDDDGDGKIDSEDPDCVGPCDNDEENLSTGLMVGNGAPCRQDCYFDGDAGPGNDKCLWSHQCDTNSVAPDYPPSGEARCAYDESIAVAGKTCNDLEDAQDPQCRSSCYPLVPNGCDCFGCCELPAGSNTYYFIGETRDGTSCGLDASGEPTHCLRCSPVPSCLNECDKCESCVGRGVDPDPSCGASVACPAGQAACTTSAQCDYQEYCVTGCCVRAPEPT